MPFFLDKIKLNNFKNYASFEDTFDPKFNVFVGLNGVGKTNLLDAIYYLSMAKSFQTNDRNLVKHGTSFFRLEGFYSEGLKKVKVSAAVVPGQSKELKWDNKKQNRRSEHIGNIPVVIVSPEDMNALLLSSENRRKLLDSILIQSDKNYLQCLIGYNRLLSQRNALLKQFHENRTWNDTLLSAIDDKMREPAEYIYSKRSEETQLLSPIFAQLYKEISNNKEACKMEYQSDFQKMDWVKLKEESKQKDKILRRTTAGIHKDDLKFLIKERKLKTFGSQGQLKSFVFALKLSQYHYLKRKSDRNPLILLDDIFDKLDDQRVESLLKIISTDEYGQIFISHTSEEWILRIFSKLKQGCKVIRVANEIQQTNEEE